MKPVCGSAAVVEKPDSVRFCAPISCNGRMSGGRGGSGTNQHVAGRHARQRRQSARRACGELSTFI